MAQEDGFKTGDDVPQTSKAKAIYVEAMGSSGWGLSLNYDMRFKSGHKGWGFRAGINQPIQEGRALTYSFPVLINTVNSNKRVALEAGAGFILAYRKWTYEDQNNVIHHNNGIEYPAVANVGVRFQPLRTGIVWRLYWAPTWRIGSSAQNTNLRWFGTSLGIGFN
ncbi:hypothetical protein GCM10028803_45540 [Larkinella knui]